VRFVPTSQNIDFPAGAVLGSAMDRHCFQGQASSLWLSCASKIRRGSALGTPEACNTCKHLPVPLPQWADSCIRKGGANFCTKEANVRQLPWQVKTPVLQVALCTCMLQPQPSSISSSSSSSSPESPRRSEDAKDAIEDVQ
jgi:hypothetical protein